MICNTFSHSSLILGVTYVKSLLDNLVHVILRNKQRHFHHTSLIEIGVSDCDNPPNICISEEFLKMSYAFVFRRRLQAVLKTLWSRLMYLPCIFVFRTRYQGVFKSSWSRRIYSTWCCVFKMSSISFKFIFKASSLHLQDVFKTTSKRLQDVFKIYLQVKHVSNTSSTHYGDISQRRLSTKKICQGYMFEKFMVRLKIFHKWTIWILGKI